MPGYSCKKCAEDLKTALLIKRRFIRAHKALVAQIRKKPIHIPDSTIIIIEDDNDNTKAVEEIVITSQSEEQSTSIEFVEVKSEMHEPSLAEKIEKECMKIKKETEVETKFINLKPGDKNESLQNIIDSFMEESKPKNAENFSCQFCSMKFEDNRVGQLHEKKHNLLKCQLCSKVVRKDNFSKHLQIHSDEPQSCKICGATFKNKESLRGHMFYLHRDNESQYICEECGKKFRTRYRFHIHKIKAHTGVRNFKCETCGKAFFTRGNLNSHINMTHKKLRPYVCEYCGTGFSSAYALKTHKRQHTNERPFECQYCGEGFKQKVSLRSHLRSKHGYEETKEYFCEHCGKGFATNTALSVHLRLHGIEKCDQCSESFADKKYLKQHIKQKHPTKIQ